MPCNSGYMDPTNKEAELQRTAKLLIYVRKQRGSGISQELEATAANQYAQMDYVAALCSELKELQRESVSWFDSIVYNGRDRTSRDLADWWEKHQEADRKREAREKHQVQLDQLRRSAIEKLTPEERSALGL